MCINVISVQTVFLSLVFCVNITKPNLLVCFSHISRVMKDDSIPFLIAMVPVAGVAWGVWIGAGTNIH